MALKARVSNRTLSNWIIDLVLFLSAIVASISGVYFLFFVIGGYQGGRNPYYGIQILFERDTWDQLHTWGGVLMIVIVVYHVITHFEWFIRMVRRIWNGLLGRGNTISSQAKLNYLINIVIAISFILTAVSGLYFLFFPYSNYKEIVPGTIFTPFAWDMIHTWAGITMIVAAVSHFIIHWRWINNVTQKVWLRFTQPENRRQAEEECPVGS